MQNTARLGVFGLGLVAMLTGCSDPQPSQSSGAGAPAAPTEAKLVVFAAASLRESFTAIQTEFVRQHPGTEVVFNFSGTQELRAQLEHGAAADVFASADQQHMGELVKARLVKTQAVFARNEPVVVTSTEQTPTLRTFADLPSAGRIVLGAPEVPIGRYSREILHKASTTLGAEFATRVTEHTVSRELNARQVLAKVTLGEADAAIVYRTDAMTAGASVSIVTIPPDLNVIAEYPIAVVTDAAHPNLADAWVTLVLSDAGQHLLEQAGFMVSGPPAP